LLTYEVGLHAGLFAIMDIQSSPTKLINADYFLDQHLLSKMEDGTIYQELHIQAHI
jgi:hypothetical protein